MLATGTSVRARSPGVAAVCVLVIASIPGGRFDGEVDGSLGAGSVDPETLREPSAGFAAGTVPVGFAPALVEGRSAFLSRPLTALDSTFLSGAVLSTATGVGSTFLVFDEFAATSVRASAGLGGAVFCPASL